MKIYITLMYEQVSSDVWAISYQRIDIVKRKLLAE